MTSKKIHKNLDDLIFNLKLTKPTLKLSEQFADLEQEFQSSNTTNKQIKHAGNLSGEQQAKINIQKPFQEYKTGKNDLIDLKKDEQQNIEDSIIIENFDDLNCYSFYQLKTIQNPTQSENDEFSFCGSMEHNLKQQNRPQNLNSLNNFFSIVDQLKTQGDQPQYDSLTAFQRNNLSNPSISFQKHKKVQKCKQNEQKIKNLGKQNYFNSSMHENKKSYTHIFKKTYPNNTNLKQFNVNKCTNQPIYTKLTLEPQSCLIKKSCTKDSIQKKQKNINQDKENLNLNSNRSLKNLNSVKHDNHYSGDGIDNKFNTYGSSYNSNQKYSFKKNTLLSIVEQNKIQKQNKLKYANYFSNKKKPFTTGKKQIANQNQICTKQKIKDFNQKIRKQNHIIYQKQLKQKNSTVSPLNQFKKSSIQPHKFSSYKLKLFV